MQLAEKMGDMERQKLCLGSMFDFSLRHQRGKWYAKALDAAQRCGRVVAELGDHAEIAFVEASIDLAQALITDPEGEVVTLTITAIMQDEPVDGGGDGDTAPDATGVGAGTASLRAERSGKGNGRVYHIYFTAVDAFGNSCDGSVVVTVPKSRGANGAAVDDGPEYDSTQAGPVTGASTRAITGALGEIAEPLEEVNGQIFLPVIR